MTITIIRAAWVKVYSAKITWPEFIDTNIRTIFNIIDNILRDRKRHHIAASIGTQRAI